jgi:CRISPR-associated protein Csb2
MLRLEIEFLSGICYAASERAASAPEYPPQADRIYSALVAAWAARGEDERERAALEWLERQDPPRIIASTFHARSSVDVFVPPNDGQTGRTGNIHLLPVRRRRQPRRFPAAVPIDPTMRLEWEAEPDAGTLERLCALGADVVYVGHSASFVRARFCRSSGTFVDGLLTRRSPYAGRLAELERAFHSW